MSGILSELSPLFRLSKNVKQNVQVFHIFITIEGIHLKLQTHIQGHENRSLTKTHNITVSCILYELSPLSDLAQILTKCSSFSYLDNYILAYNTDKASNSRARGPVTALVVLCNWFPW